MTANQTPAASAQHMNSLPSIAAHQAQDDACAGFFPADLPVSYDAEGGVASRYGDLSWDLSSMSTDGTSALTLHFYDAEMAPSGLGARIREQHKGLMWLHMDAGKTRAPRTLRLSNYALAAWCTKAAQRGVDLFAVLTNPEALAQDSRDINVTYVRLTAALVQTLWRHREQLGAPSGIQLEALRDALNNEAGDRPDSQQTPLIPSRVYCAILAALGERMDRIEGELDALLGAYGLSSTASRETPSVATPRQRNALRAQALVDVVEPLKTLGDVPGPGVNISQFVAGRLGQHQMALMLVVAGFSGMRKGEVSVLPLEDVLAEFEHVGVTHFELRGFTHKLNNGVKRPSTWITSHQGARAVRLAEQIARAILKQHGTLPKAGQQSLLFPSTENPYRSKSDRNVDEGLSTLRELVCPVIEQADIEELDRLELARGWARDDIVVGRRWPLAFHQLRRSLSVYAHRSGMVSLPALKAQLQHITQEMSSYYADGFSRAVNLVFDKEHFSHEWKAAKAESSYFAYALGVLFSDEDLLGQGVRRMANTVESRSREGTMRLFEENKLAYHETPLGGCVNTETCKADPLEPIPYDCLESNCVNLVVFGKRLDHVIRSQETVVATLERDENGGVEHRLEMRHLEVLLKARERMKGAK